MSKFVWADEDIEIEDGDGQPFDDSEFLDSDDSDDAATDADSIEAFDLDGTLAEWDGEWHGPEYIGAPIPAMVDRVKEFLAEGTPCVIFTARVANDDPQGCRPFIERWSQQVFGQVLPVTAEKTPDIRRIWDDKAVAVELNTGEADPEPIPAQDRMLSEANAVRTRIKCPRCSSQNFDLMPTDFETAKCQDCDKTWEIGIVPGLNDPGQAEDWAESEHPRVASGPEAGQFTKGGSGGGASGSGRGEYGSGKSAQMVKAHADRTKWPKHIQSMRVPPAWTDVHINPDPKAALWVTGRDAKGRKQPLYNPQFRATQDAKKFARAKEMDAKYDQIDRQNRAHLRSNDERVRENALVARLVMKMGLRPGSEKDTGAEKQAYGATTLQGRHVVEKRGTVYLKFTGKKGVDLQLPVTDLELASILKKRAQAAGRTDKLFPDVTDKSLLAYTRSLDGGGFKTKDLRTRLANQIAMEAKENIPAPANEKEFKKRSKEIAMIVAERLGNTPTVALASYINPSVWTDWRESLDAGAVAPSEQAPRSEYSKSWAKPRNKSLGRTEVKELEKTILGHGGKKLPNLDRDDYDNWQLPGRAKLATGTAKVLPDAETNSAHGVAARAWKSGKGTLYTGYARTKDRWIQHSWVVDAAGKILEGTPTGRDGYFGYPMNNKEAQGFWQVNRDNVKSKGFKIYED